MTALLVLLGLSAAWGATADEILDTAETRNRIESSIQTVRMVLVSKKGSERVRELEIKARRDGDVRKSLARFTSPSDVAGTQLLLIDAPGKIAEQALYMPFNKRTQQISGKARQGSFLGSDFSYEDFETAQRDTATHTLVDEAGDAWVIESVPGGDSQYSKVRLHVTKADYVTRKVEFFDEDGEALKVLEVEQTDTQGEVTVPVRSVMRNVQKGTSTRLEVLEQRLNVPADALPDETFTKGYMER